MYQNKHCACFKIFKLLFCWNSFPLENNWAFPVVIRLNAVFICLLYTSHDRSSSVCIAHFNYLITKNGSIYCNSTFIIYSDVTRVTMHDLKWHHSGIVFYKSAALLPLWIQWTLFLPLNHLYPHSRHLPIPLCPTHPSYQSVHRMFDSFGACAINSRPVIDSPLTLNLISSFSSLISHPLNIFLHIIPANSSSLSVSFWLQKGDLFNCADPVCFGMPLLLQAKQATVAGMRRSDFIFLEGSKRW